MLERSRVTLWKVLEHFERFGEKLDSDWSKGDGEVMRGEWGGYFVVQDKLLFFWTPALLSLFSPKIVLILLCVLSLR